MGEMFCFIEIKKSAYWRGTQGAASFFHHQEIWDEHLRDKPANNSCASFSSTLNQNWSPVIMTITGHLDDKIHVPQVLITGCWSIRPHNQGAIDPVIKYGWLTESGRLHLAER